MGKNKSRQFRIRPAFLGAVIVIIAFFLPLATCTSEYGDILRAYPDNISIIGLGMKNSEVADISMLGFFRIYWPLAVLTYDTVSVVTVSTLGICLIALFSLLMLIFSLTKHPVALIVFDVLNTLFFCG